MMILKTINFSICIIILLGVLACNENSTTEIRDLAANEEVAKFMENYEGRGVLTDPNSEPTPPDEVVKRFTFPNDLSLDLILSEPQISQPLQISFDHKGRLWVVQYQQYPYPKGLKITDIDNHTRVKFDQTPKAPPEGVKGADRITFFEDTNGDGTYDKRTDAITGLNIATGVELGRNQIWVLNPPYLLAYPDHEGDGLPDGDPKVHLEGFGLEDTHAVANSLRWGPDGWLYGAQGSTTTANISSEVSKNISFLGQAIWRYHPSSRVFEIFAEGGGNNAFNVEFDRKGRIFSGTNGYDRGPYYKQGGYYIKSWGKHGPLTNPYAFGYLPNMPLEGEKKRFTHSLIKYEGGALPGKYNDLMFAINPLHNFVQLTKFEQRGSSFTNVDEEIVLETDDKWFRPVDIKLGPDGGIYISDWYDSRLSHVDPRDTWHKSSGRIYRLGPNTEKAPLPDFDLSTYSTSDLVDLLSHQNKWFRQQALRQFGDRKDPNALPLLVNLLDRGSGQEALEALWAINLSQGISDEIGTKGLNHADPFVRMWTVRLLGDEKKVSPAMAQALQQLARNEMHPEVQAQLAATAKRLPSQVTYKIIENLLAQQKDASDPDIPLLVWWALEDKVTTDREGILDVLEPVNLWSHPIMEEVVLHRLMQRYIMEGGEENFNTSTALLELAPSPKHAKILLDGLQEGLLGREMVELPGKLLDALEIHRNELGEAPLTLALRRREEKALAEAINIISDAEKDVGLRLSYIQVLGEINQPKVVPDLMNLVKSGQSSAIIKQAALHALQAYDQKEIGEQMAKSYPAFRDNSYVREAGISLFASRKSWAMDFFREIEETKTISKNDLPYHYSQRFRLLQDPEIDKITDRIWPETKLLSASEKTDRINSYGNVIRSGEGNLEKGRSIYLSHCGSCHHLNGEGGLLGPELTGYERSNPEYLLLHVVDPHADIREGYEVQRILTTDGRTLEGRIKTQGGGTITIEPPLGGKATTLSEERIENMEMQQTSFMPERILEGLTDQEIRDLFAYLMK
ncbi:DUF7133 domain-containing protein [Lunatibacter salilacus]|uniref:DUF7133 domain-containing protein n=1 Tax=Lunatibacter salilacus TaxID=2483804 RepID=UPI001F48B3B7|nr:c-type cytochrome [Lunatibacter salilacus]